MKLRSRIRQSPSDLPDSQPDANVEREDSELQKAETAAVLQTIELRGTYARQAFQFLRQWVLVVGVFLFIDALHKPPFCQETRGNDCWLCMLPSFDIEGKVMLGVVGGTTVAVIGLALAVVKGLFPTPSQ